MKKKEYRNKGFYINEFKSILVCNGKLRRSEIKRKISNKLNGQDFNVIHFNNAENYLLENEMIEIETCPLFIEEEQYKLKGQT